MNKSELIDALMKKTGLNKRQAVGAIDALFSTSDDKKKTGIIAAEIAKGEKISLTGFGTFERRARKARQGRNPQTGATIMIAAAKYPAFAAGKAFKDRVHKRK
ncbi:MAG: HU family DNA-binding protein [Candidatus Krumholzibacteria bacterium]|jgi:nucleoid DNA-binding protein|nr:HU family DNA-binding protein [Candidatus Krumholzibacteria bacterium]MDY0108630.1 HU family DNA-binding protein [Candidatus Krumholzibacteria bacterium]